ncbi:MAG: putative ABC transporter [Monoraphidium minutum]|nr:MAG: putative ABC transporter [Monoraphidium minutum]
MRPRRRASPRHTAGAARKPCPAPRPFRPSRRQVAKLPARSVRNDNFLQRLLVTWVYGIVSAGRGGRLQQDALRMPANQAAEAASERFLQNWAREQAGGPPSLARALWRSFGGEFALAGFFKLLWSGFVLLGASYFVNALIEFVQGTMPGGAALPGDGVGWVLACSFFADSILAGLALQRMGDVAVRVGIKARAALITAVYRKSFRLNSTHGHDGGNIVSLVSTDCIKVYEGVQHCHNVWTAPLEAATIIGLLLWRTGGAYGLPALGVVVVVLPLQYYFGYRIAAYKMANVEVSDGRVLRMHEILLAIKLVKFYVWERSFARQVEEVREEELHLVRASCAVKTANLCLVFAVPPSIALVIFATYAYGVGPLTPAMAFVVLSLFNTLRFPLVVLPKALRGVSEAVAALGRIQKFLLLPESQESLPAAAEGARIEGAELHYGHPEDFTLKVPLFEVAKSEVVAVVGRVGSGKSSVLQALLSKMTATKGSVRVGGGVAAYVPQSPWVQNLSLRENILFGLPYDEARYQRVVHACALELDLKILPNGDASMAGERGINLSGGQRQRLALARATYHDADLVLLDNPLSAVDQHTSKHIFDHAIKGMLADKAVVLIAHQLELLPQCSKVAIMKAGKMVYFGPPDAAALQEHLTMDSLADATVEGKESAAAPPAAPAGAGAAGGGELIKAGGPRPHESDDPCTETAEEVCVGGRKALALNRLSGRIRHTTCSIRFPSRSTPTRPCHLTHPPPPQVAAQFSGTAKRLTAGQAAYHYWCSGGRALGVASLAIFGVAQSTRIIGDWWIRSWAADEPAQFYRHHAAADANRLYLLIYMVMVVLFVMLLVTRDTVFSMWSVRASTKLHSQLFRRVLSAPILFFLRTPVGDVLNAFARDQDTLDEALPDTLHMTGIYLMILLTSLAIVTASINYYAIMTGALFISFFMMQYLYLPAATVLKRWAGETASAVFVHVDESLHGMDVIRAFGTVDFFIQENVARLNRHHLALFNTEQTHLWLAFWCDFFGAILVVATCLMSIAFRATLGAPNVGLAISNSIQVLVFFTWVVRGVADTVSMWDAVERVTSLATQVPSELSASEEVRALPPPPRGVRGRAGEHGRNGPHDHHAQHQRSSGQSKAAHPIPCDLRFDRVSLRYFPGGPLALRGVSFHIRDCEKARGGGRGARVGVVGRTGSGKTTLLMALFRLLGLAGGRVLVDGADIASLPLQEVRKRISIIPQEPVMFKGTVRSNLDPFGEVPDNELWHALKLVHMRDAVAEMPGGLDGAVTEGGSNFSLGQKQLVCMARCVLKQTHILVLDEATAAMDLQTDVLIQRTIRRVFRGRTTLTIAHRLDTIIFSDKILAMGQGQVKEFDTPGALLGDPSSMFNRLVEDTGPAASATLRAMVAAGPPPDAEPGGGPAGSRTHSLEAP